MSCDRIANTCAATDRAWESSQDFARSHTGGGDELAPAASDSHHLWSYEVLESTGPHDG